MVPQLAELTDALLRREDRFEILALNKDACVIVSAGTGRVYGPFIDGLDRSGWVSPALGPNGADEKEDGENWNKGGSRLWIGPELDHFVHDRARFWDSYHIPTGIDPGRYTLTGQAIAGDLALTMDCQLEESQFSVRRSVSAVNPASVGKGGWINGPRICCQREHIEISHLTGAECRVQPWIINQRQHGTIYVEVKDHRNPTLFVGESGSESHVESLQAWEIPSLPAGPMRKLGFHSASVTGRMGHVHRAEGLTTFTLVQFENDPVGTYCDEPPDRVGDSGYSALVFCDDGRFGKYCEMECLGALSGTANAPASLTMITTTIQGHEVEVHEALIQLAPRMAGALSPG